jgi:hypothetical protein
LIGSGYFFQEKESLVKKQYQITKRRAAEQFAQWAKTNEVPIQLTIPTAGIAELAQRFPKSCATGGTGPARRDIHGADGESLLSRLAGICWPADA